MKTSQLQSSRDARGSKAGGSLLAPQHACFYPASSHGRNGEGVCNFPAQGWAPGLLLPFQNEPQPRSLCPTLHFWQFLQGEASCFSLQASNPSPGWLNTKYKHFTREAHNELHMKVTLPPSAILSLSQFSCESIHPLTSEVIPMAAPTIITNANHFNRVSVHTPMYLYIYILKTEHKLKLQSLHFNKEPESGRWINWGIKSKKERNKSLSTFEI